MLPTTVMDFQAKMVAIYNATQFIIANPFDHDIKYVKIFSDSQAAILALNNDSIKFKCVLRTLESIESLSYQTMVTSLN